MLPRLILFAVAVVMLVFVPIFADGPKDEANQQSAERDVNVGERVLDGDRPRDGDRVRDGDRRDQGRADREERVTDDQRLRARGDQIRRESERREALASEEHRQHMERREMDRRQAERRQHESRERDRDEEHARHREHDGEAELHERIERLDEAADLVHEAGMPDLAHEIRKRIERLEHEFHMRQRGEGVPPVPPAVRELMQEVRELRREVNELREGMPRRDKPGGR